MANIPKESRNWLYFGLTLFFLSALGSGIGTVNSQDIPDSLFGIVDWFAACIPLFFYGAVLGYGFDWYRHKRPLTSPEWVYYTGTFVLVSIISISFGLIPHSLSDVWFNLTFPLYYSVFFPSAAFVTFFPFILQKGFLIKLVLDILYLAVFTWWLYLQIKNSKNQQMFKRVLLALIFIIVYIGMIATVLVLAPLS